MGDDSNVPQYPAMFDPSQMLNKYSTVNSQSFPLYNYYGIPTDAMGNPISSYKPPAASAPAAPQTVGTTLNSVPAVGSPARAMYNSGYGDWSALDPTLGYSSIPGQSAGNQVDNADKGSFGKWTPTGQILPNQPQQAPQAASPDPTQSAGFQYLLALANPDKVVTPGVAAPPRASQPGSINLDTIIANMKSAGMAPPQSQTGIVQGTAPSSNFLNTLAALRAGSPGAK